ncbi:MAG: hypothetical protein GY696_27735 [Gammaproteobacteria bacterium]|nr:hypothetical protein [Gammaproteobacteria bacterium]
MKLTLAISSTPGEKDVFSGPWFDITKFSTLNKAKNMMYRILKHML